MIEGNSLVPGEFVHPLQAWQLESPVLNAIIIAVLATILSYQTASLVFDLILGLKSRYVTRASDFQAAILTDEASLKSIGAAIFRKDWLDRSRFPGEIPHDTGIAREPRPINKTVVLKFFVLFMSAPVLNILAVVITLERNQEITFGQAKFGGLALGVNEDFSFLATQQFILTCDTLSFKIEDHQRATASFILCNELTVTDSEGSWLSVAVVSDETVNLILVISGIQYQRSIHVDLEAKEDTFRIRQRVSERMARRLIELGTTTLPRYCVRNDSSTTDVILKRDDENGMRLWRNVTCTQMTSQAADIVLQEMASRVTLIETDALEVVKDLDFSGGKTEYERADDLILLQQRSSYVGLGTLFVATGCAVVLRIIVKLLTRNDVHDGITVLIMTCLGLQSSDSLLRSKGTVRYDHRHQQGDVAHYGVKIDDLKEVEKFVSGKVGRADDRPRALVEQCIHLTDT